MHLAKIWGTRWNGVVTIVLIAPVVIVSQGICLPSHRINLQHCFEKKNDLLEFWTWTQLDADNFSTKSGVEIEIDVRGAKDVWLELSFVDD